MLSPPKTIRDIDQGDIQKSKKPKYRRDPRAPLSVLYHPAEKKVRNVKKPEDESRCQSRIPRPPYAPGWLTCHWRIDTVEEKRSDPRSAQRPRTQTPDGLVGSFPKVDRITQRSRAVSGELLYGGQFCR